MTYGALLLCPMLWLIILFALSFILVGFEVGVLLLTGMNYNDLHVHPGFVCLVRDVIFV